jgi:hypothetical protein
VGVPRRAQLPGDRRRCPLDATLAPWVRPGRHALVVDGNLAPWIAPVAAALTAAGADLHVEQVAPGEASKALAEYGRLAAALVAAGLDRASTIFALGGGVVGDLAGFVAATLYRGVDVVHLPTTLVAMTDSAIGGKTAVDLPAGKNLLGAFHQPRAVLAHLPTLASLPPRERRAGFGELWKYALLDGEALWAAVEALAPWAQTAAAPPPAAAPVIAAAATLKAAIVSADERERRGQRLLLNLGHTSATPSRPPPTGSFCTARRSASGSSPPRGSRTGWAWRPPTSSRGCAPASPRPACPPTSRPGCAPRCWPGSRSTRSAPAAGWRSSPAPPRAIAR